MDTAPVLARPQPELALTSFNSELIWLHHPLAICTRSLLMACPAKLHQSHFGSLKLLALWVYLLHPVSVRAIPWISQKDAQHPIIWPCFSTMVVNIWPPVPEPVLLAGAGLCKMPRVWAHMGTSQTEEMGRAWRGNWACLLRVWQLNRQETLSQPLPKSLVNKQRKGLNDRLY